jgi:methionyl-tRNA formyltransferase
MPERARLTAVVLTQDEPFAVPVLLEELLGEKADRIAAVFIAPPTSRRETFGELVRRWYLAFGPWAFLQYGLRYLKGRLVGPRPAQVARRYGVEVHEVEDVNAPELLDRLREMDVDLIISAACPQILRRELLSLPPLGCINVHSGPLPRYRGMMPTFWVLYEHEDETAVSVHFMNEKLDDGPIILQEAVPIREDETQASLMGRCKVVGGRLLAQAIDLFEMDEVQTTPNPREEATYYSFPTADEGRRFRAEGGRWL